MAWKDICTCKFTWYGYFRGFTVINWFQEIKSSYNFPPPCSWVEWSTAAQEIPQTHYSPHYRPPPNRGRRSWSPRSVLQSSPGKSHCATGTGLEGGLWRWGWLEEIATENIKMVFDRFNLRPLTRQFINSEHSRNSWWRVLLLTTLYCLCWACRKSDKPPKLPAIDAFISPLGLILKQLPLCVTAYRKELLEESCYWNGEYGHFSGPWSSEQVIISSLITSLWHLPLRRLPCRWHQHSLGSLVYKSVRPYPAVHPPCRCSV